ncbi:MAG: hypothetical protein ACYTG7_00415 [Planctomycetota bacterium]|jgi:hypothetical protein
MRRVIPWLVVGCLCLIAMPAYSQNILVWDKDHDLKFQDPEGAGSVTALYGTTKALDDNGYTYNVSKTLPSDLTPYDILMIVMGTYC